MPTPYIVTENILTQAILDDFKIVQDFWAKLPDATAEQPATKRERYRIGDEKVPQYLWSCHGLCRAARRFLSLDWYAIDGWFMDRGFEHCWLWTRHKSSEVIIDVYPVGAVGGPILVDISPLAPWGKAYIERFMNYSAEERQKFDAEGHEAAELYGRLTKVAA